MACVRVRIGLTCVPGPWLKCSLWMPLWAICREAESKHRLKIFHSPENMVDTADTASAPPKMQWGLWTQATKFLQHFWSKA